MNAAAEKPEQPITIGGRVPVIIPLNDEVFYIADKQRENGLS